MTGNLASENALRSFFNNFAPRYNYLITDHLRIGETSRVKEEEIEFLKRLGFEGKNITAIAKYKDSVFPTVKFLYQHQVQISKMLAPVNSGGLGFTAQNLSSILNCAGAKAGAALSQLASKENLGNVSELQKLGFTAKNLSSILRGAGAKAGAALSQLASQENLGNVSELQKLGFTAQNISSIIRGAGAKAGAALSQLASKENFDNVSKLLSSVNSGGLGLTGESLYSIISGTGANFTSRVKNILKIEPLLKEKNPTKSQHWINYGLGKICKKTNNKNPIDNPSLTNEDFERIVNETFNHHSESATLTEQNGLNENQSQEYSPKIELEDDLNEILEIFGMPSPSQNGLDGNQSQEYSPKIELEDDLNEILEIFGMPSPSQNGLDGNQSENNALDITKENSRANNKRECPSSNPKKSRAEGITKTKHQRYS